MIERQGPPYDIPRVSLVATLIFAAALAAGVGSVTKRPEVARVLLVGTSGGLWILGVGGMFSIGLPLVVAGTLIFIGAMRSPRPA